MMNDKISKRQYNSAVPISIGLQKIAKDVLGKRGFSSVDLIARWEEVVGENLAQGVKPDKIVYPNLKRGAGVLHVRVQSGAFAAVLGHQKNIILDRVNTFLGYEAVCDIKIRQDNQIKVKIESSEKKEPVLAQEDENKLQERLGGISDEVIKTQLYQIGKKLFLK
ncbi:MAG: DUF721 domain-containing protein [Alphaproteobacteria bacterium]|nr:DUF721 domain-containing protein [Alphaproteobacteria bacterium]